MIERKTTLMGPFVGFGTAGGWKVDNLALKLRGKGGLEPVSTKVAGSDMN
jgi:hypothetical protein